VWRALPAPLCVQVHSLAAAVLEDITAGPARDSKEAGWVTEGASREYFKHCKNESTGSRQRMQENLPRHTCINKIPNGRGAKSKRDNVLT
jgi:hypothetical protein